MLRLKHAMGFSRSRRAAEGYAGDRSVLVDQSTEHVVATDSERRQLPRRSSASWHTKAQATARTARVVVGEVLAQDGFKMATPEHEGPIEALRPRCSHKPFRVRVRPRRADGRLDDLGTFRSEDLVETGGELRVPVPDEELHRATCLGQVGGQLPGGLGDKAGARVFGDAKEVGLPGGVLDGEEDIEALEQHRVNGEEVRRQDPFRLGFEELCPARASPGCRPQAMAAKDASDRRRPHPDSELAQLALDAYTTPAAVLSPQAHDQLHQLRTHRRPPRASLPPPSSPFPSSGFSVPTQQRRRRD